MPNKHHVPSTPGNRSAPIQQLKALTDNAISNLSINALHRSSETEHIKILIFIEIIDPGGEGAPTLIISCADGRNPIAGRI
jgi:hypothetical protein